MIPHPQRCETCDKKGTDKCPFDVELTNRDGCDILVSFRRDIPILPLDQIGNLCGLMCHSSQQSERDKVLDYLDEWVNSGENLTLFKWELREVLRELRSNKGGEQR